MPVAASLPVYSSMPLAARLLPLHWHKCLIKLHPPTGDLNLKPAPLALVLYWQPRGPGPLGRQESLRVASSGLLLGAPSLTGLLAGPLPGAA